MRKIIFKTMINNKLTCRGGYEAPTMQSVNILAETAILTTSDDYGKVGAPGKNNPYLDYDEDF